MTKILAGKAALVTGGSRGIGAGIVRRLADDGASVAFTYSSSGERAQALVAEMESRGAKVLAIKADSADPRAVKEAVEHTFKHFGALDILVNNAGIVKGGLVDDYPLETFDNMFAVNVRAAFVAIQAAMAHMKTGGRIINISSVVAHHSAFPGTSAYAMTKGALSAMTKALSRDLGPRGITVNALEPGPTETDNIKNDEIREMLRPKLALGRLGTDSEIASFAAYLASPGASFITGALLTIDGGYIA